MKYKIKRYGYQYMVCREKDGKFYETGKSYGFIGLEEKIRKEIEKDKKIKFLIEGIYGVERGAISFVINYHRNKMRNELNLAR